MNVTDRDLTILELLLTCGYLVTQQIRGRLFPTDKDGSVARDRLRKLEAAGFVARRRAEVANPLMTSTMPVWIITERGICHLSLRKDDPRIANRKPPCTRSWPNFAHYVAVSDVGLDLRTAVERQTRVSLGDLFFEHTVVNPEAQDAPARYKLYTVVTDEHEPKRIVCAPDAAAELSAGGYRRAFYWELERGSDSPARVAAKKSPGFAGLFERRLWVRHFPQAADFRVLCIAPSANWRDSLRKAIRDKQGAELWLFAARTDLTPDSFLHGDVIYTATDGPRPLVRPETATRQG